MFLPTRLVVDLSEVSCFDVAGVDVLLSAQERGKDHSTELVVQAPSSAVRECLEATGVADLLPVRNGPDVAVEPHRRRPFLMP